MDCPFCGNDRFITHTEMMINRWNQTLYYAHNSQFYSPNMLNNCLIQVTNGIELIIACSRRKIIITDYKKEFIPHNGDKEIRFFEVLLINGYNTGP